MSIDTKPGASAAHDHDHDHHHHGHDDGCGCGHDHHHHDHGHHHHHQSTMPFVRATPKVGRNEACPCGSGKKYKKCCAA